MTGLEDQETAGTPGKEKVMTIEITCPDCGQLIGTLDAQYVEENPIGSEMAREQMQLRHDAAEHPETDVIDVCPDCGEVIWRGDIEYVTEYPNGSDMARSAAATEHSLECPAVDHWGDWRAEAGARSGETPQALLARMRLHGATLQELLKVPAPPDWCHCIDGEIEDWWWFDFIEDWWDEHGGPLTGADYARACQNGWV